MQHAHCSYCGAAFAPDAPWPRVCAACGETTWRNPLPVAVALVPVDTSHGRGLVVVRRDIDPGRGELGLPGGFIEVGESWQEATVRELREETAIEAEVADVTLFDVHSAPSGTLLVFGLLPAVESAPDLRPNDETLGLEVLTGPVELGFSLHTDVVRRYFGSLADPA